MHKGKNNMVKSELVDKLSDKLEANASNLSRQDTKLAVDIILQAISQTLASHDRAEIRGFGSFDVRIRPPRRGRNPSTGQSLQVPSVAVPYFKCGKQLRALLNQQAGA